MADSTKILDIVIEAIDHASGVFEHIGSSSVASADEIKASADKSALAMDKTALSSKEASAKVKESGESAKEAGGGFNGLWKSMAGGFLVSQVAFAALGEVKHGIDEVKQSAQDWQQQQAQLTAALKSTNDVSGVTRENANQYAEALSKSTPITRDAVLAGENMLLTFTSIHKNVFPQTTKAVADMATRMSGGAVPSMQQMNDTAIMVGKALNDPATGMTKLQRVGVTFTAQQKEQIKTMEAAGNVTGAQTIILNELSKEFGGSASANAQTFQGRITMLKNTMIDWGVDTLPKIENELNKFFGWLIKIGGEKSFKNLMHDIKNVIQDYIMFYKLLVEALTGGDPTISKSEARFAGLARVMATIGYYFDEFRTALKLVWEAFRGGDPTLDRNHLQMAKFVQILLQAKEIITTVAGVVVSVFKTAWNIATDAIDGLLPSIKALFGALASNIIPVLKEVWQAVTRLYNALEPALNDIIKVLAVIIGVTLYAAIWLAINALRIIIQVFAFVVRAITDVIDWISNLISWFGTAVVALARLEVGFIKFFLALPGKISAAVSGFGSLLLSAGKDLMDGLEKGIEDAGGHVFDAVKGVGDKAVKELKGVLKIFSPSQVFADIGQNVGLGLAQGITGTEHIATKASAGLGKAVIAGGSNISLPAPSQGNRGVAGSSGITININYQGRGQFSYQDAVAMGKQIILALRTQGLSTDNFNNVAVLR